MVARTKAGSRGNMRFRMETAHAFPNDGDDVISTGLPNPDHSVHLLCRFLFAFVHVAVNLVVQTADRASSALMCASTSRIIVVCKGGEKSVEVIGQLLVACFQQGGHLLLLPKLGDSACIDSLPFQDFVQKGHGILPRNDRHCPGQFDVRAPNIFCSRLSSRVLSSTRSLW